MPSNNLPLVTIITPTYNHCEFLEDAILSVKNQTYPNIEHLIFDAGSQDGTVELLKKYEGSYLMKWVSEKDDGMSNAINKGIRISQGEIVTWLNADDVLMYRDGIEQVVKTFLKNSKPEVIVGNMAFLDKEGVIIQMYGYSKVNLDYLLSSQVHIGQPSVFIRGDIFRENLLHEELHYAMDFELWLRLAKKYSFVQIRTVLSGSRMYPGTKSSHVNLYQGEKDLVLKSHDQTFKPQSKLSARISNGYAIKIRGLLLLIWHRYIARSVLAAPRIHYHIFPKDFLYQIFRKMREDYSTYWPTWFSALMK